MFMLFILNVILMIGKDNEKWKTPKLVMLIIGNIWYGNGFY